MKWSRLHCRRLRIPILPITTLVLGNMPNSNDAISNRGWEGGAPLAPVSNKREEIVDRIRVMFCWWRGDSWTVASSVIYVLAGIVGGATGNSFYPHSNLAIIYCQITCLQTHIGTLNAWYRPARPYSVNINVFDDEFANGLHRKSRGGKSVVPLSFVGVIIVPGHYHCRWRAPRASMHKYVYLYRTKVEAVDLFDWYRRLSGCRVLLFAPLWLATGTFIPVVWRF
jgi:hypothetical protein